MNNIGTNIQNVISSIGSIGETLVSWIRNGIDTMFSGFETVISWLNSGIQNMLTGFQNIGTWLSTVKDNILTGISGFFDSLFDWFEHNFTIDFEKAKEHTGLRKAMQSKFSVFGEIYSIYSQGQVVMETAELFMEDAVENDTSIDFDNAELLETREHGGAGGYYGDDFDVDMTITMSIPVGDQWQEVIVFDINQPHLLRIFYWCRAFINAALWIAFGTYLLRRVAPKLGVG